MKRRLVVLAVAACVALIVVPVGLVAASGSAPALQASQPSHHVTMSHGPATRAVLSALSAARSALSATTDSGNFDFSYQLTETSQRSRPTLVGPGPICSPTSCPPGSVTWSTEVRGSGTINTNPMAMAVSLGISSIGSNGSNAGGFAADVRVDPTRVWLFSNGQDLPGFAGVAQGFLGSREGAVAMLFMASPTGYLDLVDPAVSSATEVGTATVDGVAVTRYQLSIDPHSLATAPATSPEEQSTISSALGKLALEGFQAMRDVISIDAAGFIRESASTVKFSDGQSVTLDAHFSNFGCAGTVLMPGQGGVSTAPSRCVSTDTAPTSTTTTTTTTSPLQVEGPSPPGVQSTFIKDVRFLDSAAVNESNGQILKQGKHACNELKRGTSAKRLASEFKGPHKAVLIEASAVLCPRFKKKVFRYYAIATSPDSSITLDNVANLTVDWTATTQGTSSPVEANGIVYVVGGGTLHALNAATGRTLWTRPDDWLAVFPPTVFDGNVYVEGKSAYVEDPSNASNPLHDLMGKTEYPLKKLNAKTGAVEWTVHLDCQAWLPVVVYGGLVYAAAFGCGSSATLYALSESSGATVWTAPQKLSCCSMAAANGLLYAAPWAGLSALKATTGTTVWSAPSVGGSPDGPGLGIPAVANGIVYAVGSENPWVYALNASTGATIWVQKTGLQARNSVAASPVVANGIVYVSGGHNVYAFDGSTGATVWSYTGPGFFSSPAVANGIVYVGSNDGVDAFDAATGRVVWTYATGGSTGFSSPAVANGILYVASNDKLYAFKPLRPRP